MWRNEPSTLVYITTLCQLQGFETLADKQADSNEQSVMDDEGWDRGLFYSNIPTS
jgi:hypothetical protein